MKNTRKWKEKENVWLNTERISMNHSHLDQDRKIKNY